MTNTNFLLEDTRENTILYTNFYRETFNFASKFLINASLGIITGNFLLNIYAIRHTIDNQHHDFRPFFDIYEQNFILLILAMALALVSYVFHNGLLYMNIVSKLTDGFEKYDAEAIRQPIPKKF